MKTELICCAALCACASGVLAATNITPDTTRDKLEHVLVTVPLHKANTDTAFPVDILDGDTLSREASGTLGDTLSNLPGINNASFGPGVGQPVIRGLQGPRVMVLQNGTRSADVSSLSADHAVAVEALLADSIEVLRGPATLLYGGGAIGGVVNVIDGRIPTKRIGDTSLTAEYRYEGASKANIGVARADFGLGDFAWHADVMSRAGSDLRVPNGTGSEDGDTLENTDMDAWSGTLGGSYHFGESFFGISVARIENEYGLPAGTHEHHDEDHEDEGIGAEAEDIEDDEGGIRLDMVQTRYDAALHLHEPLPGFEVLRVFTTLTDYEHVEVEPSGEIGTRYLSDSLEARAELTHRQWGGFHGALGLHVSDGEFSALGEEAFVPATDVQRRGIFALEDWHAGAVTVELGLRLDRDELKPQAGVAPQRDFTAVSASAGVVWDLSPRWSTSVAVTRAERAPSVEEIYSNFNNVGPDTWVTHEATGAIELGDINLDTERSLNWELGLDWRYGGHHARLAIYHNDFSNYIDIASTGIDVEEAPVRQYLEGDAQFYGAEFEAGWGLGELVGGDVLLTTTADFVQGELDDRGDVPRLPPMRVALGLDWESDLLALYTKVTVASSQDRPGENESATDGYTQWMAGADWRIEVGDVELTLRAMLDNILDEEVRLSTSYLRDVAPEAGRSLSVGFRLLL